MKKTISEKQYKALSKEEQTNHEEKVREDLIKKGIIKPKDEQTILAARAEP